MLNFKLKTLPILLPFLLINHGQASINDFLPDNSVIINSKSHTFQNKVYTYYKVRNELSGKHDLFVVDENGKKIEDYSSFHNEIPFLGLQKRLSSSNGKNTDEFIEVELLLNREKEEEKLNSTKVNKFYGKLDLKNNNYELYENDVLVKKEEYSLKLKQKQTNQKEKAHKNI